MEFAPINNRRHLLNSLFPGRREIDALEVRCENAGRGCPWTGTVGTLDNHMVSCQFNLVPCPNNCKEDKADGDFLLMWKDVEEHLKTECPKRAYECSNCGKEGTFVSITEDHDIVCEKKTVVCPNKENGCSLSMERMKTKEHVNNDCRYTEVACAYESLGCGVRVLRKDRAAHENEDREKHMDLSLTTITSLSDQLQTLTEQNKILSENHNKESEEHEKLSVEHKNLIDCVRLQDEQLKLMFECCKKESEQHEKNYKKLTATVQLHHEQLKTLTEHYEKESDQHKENHTNLSEVVSLQDNQLKLLTEQNKTLPGEAVVFKVSGFASKKMKNEIFYSPPFYTHPGGYRMCVLVVANGHGDGKGTHVSVFIKPLQGQYDGQLHWPFQGTITYELLNQLQDVHHHKLVSTLVSRHDLTVGSGSSGPNKFLSHTSLNHPQTTNSQYLCNDTLYFRVSVSVATHKPWLDCTHYS